MKELIQTFRNILLRTLIISLAFALLIAVICYGGRSHWNTMIVDRWQLIDQPSLNLVITDFFMLIRFYLVFALLAPALALHWTLKRLDHIKH